MVRYCHKADIIVPSPSVSLANRINSKHDEIRVVCFDLYALMLDVLHSKNYLDKVKQMVVKPNVELGR